MSDVTNKSWFQVVTAIGMIILLTLFWLVVFAALESDPDNLNYEPFSGASIVFALLTYFILLFVKQYYRVVHLKQEISSSFYAIAIKEKHVTDLLTQLHETADKIVDHELKMSVKKTVSELVEEERLSDSLTSDSHQAHHEQEKKKHVNQSGSAGSHDHLSQVSDKVTRLVERLERDTDSRADQSLYQMMAEIKEAQGLVTNQRLHHNDTVFRYNKAIYALPFAFLRRSLGHEEQVYI